MKPDPTSIPLQQPGHTHSGLHKLRQRVDQAAAEIGTVLLGKERQVKLALCCLFAGGHLLLEDRPGMGKTTLSQALARVFGLDFTRIQFTSDLLPADILGVSIFEQASASFRFHPGPVFSNLLLADEINRSTPKTQSALLEAMEEGQVSIDGETRPLPEPFFVIATQNPVSFSGTYPLPESQLDRFLMRLSIGYPDPGAERRLLEQGGSRQGPTALRQCFDAADIQAVRERVDQVHASATLLDYLQRLVACTRQHERFSQGLSPRGALALMRAARTWALLHEREHLLPEDLQTVLPAVVDHRLRGVLDGAGRGGEGLSRYLLDDVNLFTG